MTAELNPKHQHRNMSTLEVFSSEEVKHKEGKETLNQIDENIVFNAHSIDQENLIANVNEGIKDLTILDPKIDLIQQSAHREKLVASAEVVEQHSGKA